LRKSKKIKSKYKSKWLKIKGKKQKANSKRQNFKNKQIPFQAPLSFGEGLGERF
jgi:hypothetical protein